MRLSEILCESLSGNWKTIPGWEKYEISDEGIVRNKVSGLEVSQWNHTGKGTTYKRVTLRDKGKRWNPRVHRLVALAFVPNPNNENEVDHIDGNSFNNNASNLEWVHGKENIKRMHSRIRGPDIRMVEPPVAER